MSQEAEADREPGWHRVPKWTLYLIVMSVVAVGVSGQLDFPADGHLMGSHVAVYADMLGDEAVAESRVLACAGPTW